MRRGRHFLPILTLILILAGCSGGAATPTEPLATPTAPPAVTAEPAVTPTPAPTPTPPPTIPPPTRTVEPPLPPVRGTPGEGIATTVEAKLAPAQVVSRRVSALSFADAAHGWMVLGDPATLRHDLYATADGGVTWTPQYPVAAVTALDAVSPTVAWATDNGKLLATEDGGATWQQRQGPDSPSIRDVDFVDPQRGWVTAAGVNTLALFRTLDGGKTWAEVTTPRPCEQVSFVSPTVGWLLCDYGGVRGQTARSLYRTDDGGRNWTLLAESATGAGSVLPTTSGVASFFFSNATDGWLSVTGETRATTDGGTTWQRATLPARTAAQTDAVYLSFLSREEGFVALSGEYTELSATEDGGATWVPRYSTGLWPQGPIAMVDRAGGFGAGTVADAAAILATEDRGHSWQPIGTLGPDGGEVQQLWFADRQHGWALSLRRATAAQGASCVFSRTLDGGKSWQPLPTPPIRGSCGATTAASFAFVDAATGFLTVREDDTVVFMGTRDGGASYQRIGTIARVQLSETHRLQVQFASAREGWAQVGAYLFATADGGATWKQLPRNYRVALPPAAAAPVGTPGAASAPTYDLGSFLTLGDGRGWLLITVQDVQQRVLVILRTADNGQTWARYAFPNAPAGCERSGENIASVIVDFVDPDNGWLIGRGSLCHTADGGRNWTQAR